MVNGAFWLALPCLTLMFVVLSWVLLLDGEA